MIQIQNASKVYSTAATEFQALNDVTLRITRGEIFGIIGRSGAGKSTLLRLINHLEQPTRGAVLIDDREVGALDARQLRALRQRIGFVFQHFNLLHSKTVTANVRLPLKVAGRLAPQAQRQRVRELLALVGIGTQGDKYPAALSGGQRQRVGIARALANEPDILLCDEATSATPGNSGFCCFRAHHNCGLASGTRHSDSHHLAAGRHQYAVRAMRRSTVNKQVA